MHDFSAIDMIIKNKNMFFFIVRVSKARAILGFFNGVAQGRQDPVRVPWEKSWAPTQVGWHKKGTAQVLGQLISLFINKNHWTGYICSQLLSLSKQMMCVCRCVCVCVCVCVWTFWNKMLSIRLTFFLEKRRLSLTGKGEASNYYHFTCSVDVMIFFLCFLAVLHVCVCLIISPTPVSGSILKHG